MKIAIIGAGFTGLSAAYYLSKLGNTLTLFEKDENPGGLAVGFKLPKWNWSLEKHYHHWFTNDYSTLNLAKELNFEVITKRPKTSTLINNLIYQLDSVKSLLAFPKLPIFDRVRMAFALASLKYNPFWQTLENIKATDFLPKIMGKSSYEMIWNPLFTKKFGNYKDDISLAWFWARINKRTSTLSYPKGGFLEFANILVKKIEKLGGKVFFNTQVEEIDAQEIGVQIKYKMENGRWKMENYDKVIATLPSFHFLKIAPHLPQVYKNKLMNLKGIGAINLILRLKQPFLKDGTYWLNICDKDSPIMAIVEHTNFMDKKYYDNEHIVYLGNYLPYDHPYMKMSAPELLKVYTPYLKRINPNFELLILNFELFKVPFAQPIIPLNYSKIIPPFETPLKNVYLANIQQVYPWDRGTNYAVELGEKVAKLILTNS